MSYHNRASPKVIPRVKLSPKIKQQANAPAKVVKVAKKPVKKVSPKKVSPKKVRKVTKTPKKVGVIRKSPKKITSPYQRSKSKAFLENKEKFRQNPSVNPITNRQIKENGETYNKLVKLYGKPY
jgi:hypothetical protein